MRSRVAVLLLAAALALTGLTACTADEDRPRGERSDVTRGEGDTGGTEPREVARTKVRIGEVAGSLSRRRRDAVRRDVGKVVDRWFARSFLGGDYPRRTFADAFPAFTDAARRRAGDDRAVLTNQRKASRFGAVYAKKRQLRVDVLAPGGRAHAATARFLLRFAVHDREGRPEGRRTIRGRLFLTRGDGGGAGGKGGGARWRVFGYDVAAGDVQQGKARKRTDDKRKDDKRKARKRTDDKRRDDKGKDRKGSRR